MSSKQKKRRDALYSAGFLLYDRGENSTKAVVQKQVIPLPKASSMERMKQNQDLFSFALSQEEMYRLDTMPPTGWSGQHPDR